MQCSEQAQQEASYSVSVLCCTIGDHENVECNIHKHTHTHTLFPLSLSQTTASQKKVTTYHLACKNNQPSCTSLAATETSRAVISLPFKSLIRSKTTTEHPFAYFSQKNRKKTLALFTSSIKDKDSSFCQCYLLKMQAVSYKGQYFELWVPKVAQPSAAAHSKHHFPAPSSKLCQNWLFH